MGLLGSILKTGFDVVTTPIELAKDAVTMAGAMTESEEPYTFKKIKQIGEDLEEIREELKEI